MSDVVGVVEVEVSGEKLWQVRRYDRLCGYWVNITDAVSHKAALEVFNFQTDNGTKNAKYEDGQYYVVFPADTKMLHSHD